MIALAVLLAVVAPDPGRADEEARKVLEKPRVGFCHDPKYPLTNTEAGWCPPVGPDKNSRCPAFASACKAPRARLDDPGRLDFSRGRAGGDTNPDRKPDERSPDTAGKSDKEPSGERKQPKRRVLEQDDDYQLPPLGGLGLILFWTVLGAGLLLLIYLIVRNSTRDKPDEVEPVAAPDELGPAPAAHQNHEQLVRDVDALLEQARAAASAGDYPRAIQRAHAALLHRLDHDGLIRVAPSRTNGDYVRDLQPEPDLRREVRDIVRDVEQVQFGATPPDASLYERVLRRVIPIATRRGAALLALLAVNLLSCDEQHFPFDLSPSGADPVIELAAVYDLHIKFRTTALADLDPDEDLGDDNRGRTLVLLHDAPFPDDETWAHLLEWAENGHHLVIAGRAPPPDLGISIESGDAPGHDLAVGPDFLDLLGEQEVITADDSVLVPTRADGRTLLAYADGRPHAIQFDRGYRGGDVTVFADDRLFTAAALMLRDNPEFLIRFLLDLGAADVEFADGLLELGADTPAEAIANTHLTPFILQLLALLAIFYLCRGVPFGRPHDPPSRSRRQFAEHVEALGHQYARARASRHAARLYAAWALDRLREKTLMTRTPGIYPLAQAIAGRTGDDDNRVMETLVEASSLRDATTLPAAGTTASADDLRLMQDLARLVRLVGGPR